MKIRKIKFLTLAKHIAELLDEKKARDIKILNVRRFSPLTEYMVLATVDSFVQMRAVIGHLAEKLQYDYLHRDWQPPQEWAVLDYGGVIVHLFSPERRTLFNLEKIWTGARNITYVKKRN